jgi:hypothetical protein
MKTNLKVKSAAFTHEGAPAIPSNPYQELRRAVLSCLLWENQFYESGEDIATRIANLVKLVPQEKVAQLAIDARTKFKLRHAPLLLVREMARSAKGNIVGRTLSEVIQRPDEMGEFLSIYWREGRCPLSKQVKIGLGNAMKKFNEYQLAKWGAQ